jgi:alpha-glucosidase (family GH31 glycosyl hydrolase)
MLSTCVMSCEQPNASDKLSFPPYAISNFRESSRDGSMVWRNAPLGQSVISPAALHADGTREYDAHNLYGTNMAIAHWDSVARTTGKRPFLVSRCDEDVAADYTRAHM